MKPVRRTSEGKSSGPWLMEWESREQRECGE